MIAKHPRDPVQGGKTHTFTEIELGLLQTQMAPKTAQRQEVRVCELRVRQNAQRAESGRARDAPGKWAMGMGLRQRNIKLSLALGCELARRDSRTALK